MTDGIEALSRLSLAGLPKQGSSGGIAGMAAKAISCIEAALDRRDFLVSAKGGGVKGTSPPFRCVRLAHPEHLSELGQHPRCQDGVDERAAPSSKDAANRGLHGAAVDAELLSSADFHGPAPERSQFVRLCYKNWPFVSSGRQALVPRCRR